MWINRELGSDQMDNVRVSISMHMCARVCWWKLKRVEAKVRQGWTQ